MRLEFLLLIPHNNEVIVVNNRYGYLHKELEHTYNTGILETKLFCTVGKCGEKIMRNSAKMLLTTFNCRDSAKYKKKELLFVSVYISGNRLYYYYSTFFFNGNYMFFLLYVFQKY